MGKPGLHLTAVCEICKSTFRQARIDQIYCSSKCGGIAWRNRNEARIGTRTGVLPPRCRQCLSIFKRERRGQFYCSKTCCEKSYRERLKKRSKYGKGKSWASGTIKVDRAACVKCGNKFYCPPVRRRRSVSGDVFCSEKCRALVIAEKIKRNRPVLVCSWCGIEFTIPQCLRGRRKFCRDECRRAAKSAKPKACKQCGKMYVGPNQNYCSMACYGLSNTKSIKAKDKQCVCETCGKKFTGSSYDALKGMSRFCGRRCFAAYRSKTASASHSYAKGGRRTDLDGLYVRSSWEANYARYLNLRVSRGEISGWSYESDTFEFHKYKRGVRFYTPDFKVVLINGEIEYHEVKGYMDGRSATKLKRMVKHYPEVKVVLICKEEYWAIELSHSADIKLWERKK